jgi:hypothetical protein
MRAMEAAERRQQRDAKKRQRELERQTKEMAKLSALEQARLEVETYENTLDVLLSIHKEQADPLDWLSLAASLPPVPPRRQSHNEFRIRQRLAVSPSQTVGDTALVQAQQHDEREYQAAHQAHTADMAEWMKMSSLARRVLQGGADAYIEAIEEISPFAELAGIGSSLHFTVHNARLIEVVLSTNGRKSIPTEVKSLTASGKISVKAMPKQRFIEIYQDYICGCVLRVARELFALLPIETLLITSSAEALDTSTGQNVERPFLSAVIPRAILNALNFDKLDPSDSIMSLAHRGDLKASRKTGDFEFITPLTISDLSQDASAGVDLNTILATAQRLRADLAAQCAALNPESAEDVLTDGES